MREKKKKSAAVFLYPDGGNKILHNNIVTGERGDQLIAIQFDNCL